VEKQELLDALSAVPDGVRIYVSADHPQTAIELMDICYTDATELPYYGEDIVWYQHPENFDGKVTAILLCD